MSLQQKVKRVQIRWTGIPIQQLGNCKLKFWRTGNKEELPVNKNAIAIQVTEDYFLNINGTISFFEAYQEKIHLQSTRSKQNPLSFPKFPNV